MVDRVRVRAHWRRYPTARMKVYVVAAMDGTMWIQKGKTPIKAMDAVKTKHPTYKIHYAEAFDPTTHLPLLVEGNLESGPVKVGKR